MNKFWIFVFVGVMIMTTIGQARTSSDADLAVQYASSGWIEDAESRTWSYSSADAPTYIFSVDDDMTEIISVGMRLRFKQSAGTYKYAGVTAVGSYSGGVTLITVYCGTDYDLDNEAVTNVAYSAMKAPFGFPMQKSKWTVSVSDTSSRTQATPTSDTWYNLHSSHKIDVPIGAWVVEYGGIAQVTTAATSTDVFFTLSTANNSESDKNNTTMSDVGAAGEIWYTSNKTIDLVLTVKATYYLNVKTFTGGTNLSLVGTYIPTYLRAVWAGL